MRNSVSWNARTIKPVPAWISGSSLICDNDIPAEDLQGFQADVHHILVDLTGTDPRWILYTQQ